MLTPPGVFCDPARLWHACLTSKQMLHQSDDSHSGGGGKPKSEIAQDHFLSGTIWLGSPFLSRAEDYQASCACYSQARACKHVNVPLDILLSQQDTAVMLPGNIISILLWQAADSSAEQQQILLPSKSAGGSCFNR